MDSRWSVRTAAPEDRAQIRRLVRDAHYRHEHLDWVEALDLLGQRPFLLARSGRECLACLACPPDVPGLAWLRLLMVSRRVPPADIWPDLWEPAAWELAGRGVDQAAALTVGDWLVPILESAGFRRDDRVVFLAWEGSALEKQAAPAELRAIRTGDLPAVAAVDHLAFAPLWQLSERSLRQALDQAATATVAVVDRAIVGYQICTGSSLGAHLARLAVDPRWQRRGIGRLLVSEALRQLHRGGRERVTVNTQESNLPSLALYSRLGFRRTGQNYPVYLRQLRDV